MRCAGPDRTAVITDPWLPSIRPFVHRAGQLGGRARRDALGRRDAAGIFVRVPWGWKASVDEALASVGRAGDRTADRATRGCYRRPVYRSGARKMVGEQGSRRRVVATEGVGERAGTGERG
jgi:hypothetical protein